MTRASRTHGFTLAELLVATTLLAITMTAVYTAFSGAIATWKRGEANYQTYDTARLVLGMMSRDIASMHPDTGHLVEGKGDDLQFYAVSSPMYIEKGAYPRMLQLRYRLKAGSRNAGRTLVREEAFVESALPALSGRQDTIDTTRIKLGNSHIYEIADGINELSFTYHWAPPAEFLLNPRGKPRKAVFVSREEIPTDSGMPHAVSIKLVVADPVAPTGETTFVEHVTFRHAPAPSGEILDELRVHNVPGFEIAQGNGR